MGTTVCLFLDVAYVTHSFLGIVTHKLELGLRYDGSKLEPRYFYNPTLIALMPSQDSSSVPNSYILFLVLLICFILFGIQYGSPPHLSCKGGRKMLPSQSSPTTASSDLRTPIDLRFRGFCWRAW
jgi:hypothetical protein